MFGILRTQVPVVNNNLHKKIGSALLTDFCMRHFVVTVHGYKIYEKSETKFCGAKFFKKSIPSPVAN